MDALLESDFQVAAKDRLYRCLDRVLEHKQELFVWLKQKWAELFAADFEVLARRVWVMDRRIPTEATLAEMREPGRETFRSCAGLISGRNHSSVGSREAQTFRIRSAAAIALDASSSGLRSNPTVRAEKGERGRPFPFRHPVQCVGAYAASAATPREAHRWGSPTRS